MKAVHSPNVNINNLTVPVFVNVLLAKKFLGLAEQLIQTRWAVEGPVVFKVRAHVAAPTQ
jgi:hypothetical protein